jgi:hypothetical protein
VTVREGACDYCERDRLLDTGDERSIMNHGLKLWCGGCREGSRDRYRDAPDELMRKMKLRFEALLEASPIRWGTDPVAPVETFEERAQKLWWLDEGWRIKNELEYRELEAKP